MSSIYQVIAVTAFSLSVVCVLIAVVLFFVLHIRQVREALTGKQARKRVEELRASSGRWSNAKRRSVAEQSMVDASQAGWNSTDLHGAWSGPIVDSQAEDDNLQTTMLRERAVGMAAHADEESEGTTLLADTRAVSEPNTDDDEDLATGLLVGRQSSAADADIDDDGQTTLLRQGKGNKN